MADSYGALIKTTTATTGTNDYVLDTTALTTAHRTPKQAVADGSLTDGDIVQYMVRDTTVTGDASFELGEGIYTDATNEIARDAANVHDGSNGPGALTVWPGSGLRDLYLVVSPSNQLARIDRVNAFTQNQGIGGAPGVTLDVLSVSSAQLRVKNSGTAQVNLILDASPTTANANLGTLSGRWAGTFVSGVRFVTGADTVNEDDGYIVLENTSGGSTEEVLRIGTATDHKARFSQDVEIDQVGAGDAVLQFSIVGDAYAIGIDNTDDSFKVSYAAAAGTAVLGTNDRIIIDSSGRVSIGPVAPSTQLHVHDTTGLNEIRIQSTAVNGICSLGLRNDARLYRLQIDGASSDNFQIIDDTSSTIPFVIEAASPTNSLVIDSAGKTSIGGLLNLTQTSTTSDPTTTEYPADGDVGVHHNTTSGNRFFVWNDGATIFKVQMT